MCDRQNDNLEKNSRLMFLVRGKKAYICTDLSHKDTWLTLAYLYRQIKYKLLELRLHTVFG